MDIGYAYGAFGIGMFPLLIAAMAAAAMAANSSATVARSPNTPVISNKSAVKP